MTEKPITSLQNPRVKRAARLRDRRQREKQDRFLIDGGRELGRAIAAGIELKEVFICRPLCHSPESREVLRRLPETGATIFEVIPKVFEKLAFGDRAEGVLGVARTPHRSLHELVLPDEALVAVIEGVTKPGNVGAVLRSADGAGVSALVVTEAGTDLYNPNAIRASLGTIFTVPVCAASTQETLAWLRERQMKIYAARTDAAITYTDADYRGHAAIVLGSEAEGLSPAWTAEDITAVRLPMRGEADSLNVSAAAAVLFYEALRQRGS